MECGQNRKWHLLRLPYPLLAPQLHPQPLYAEALLQSYRLDDPSLLDLRFLGFPRFHHRWSSRWRQSRQKHWLLVPLHYYARWLRGPRMVASTRHDQVLQMGRPGMVELHQGGSTTELAIPAR